MTEEQTTHHTTDHETIRGWVEARGGHPAQVRGSGADAQGPGSLRIDFPGYSGGESLLEIDWEDFFREFDQGQLVFLYQEQTIAGQPSNFNEIVHRSSLRERGEG